MKIKQPCKQIVRINAFRIGKNSKKKNCTVWADSKRTVEKVALPPPISFKPTNLFSVNYYRYKLSLSPRIRQNKYNNRKRDRHSKNETYTTLKRWRCALYAAVTAGRNHAHRLCNEVRASLTRDKCIIIIFHCRSFRTVLVNVDCG